MPFLTMYLVLLEHISSLFTTCRYISKQLGHLLLSGVEYRLYL